MTTATAAPLAGGRLFLYRIIQLLYGFVYLFLGSNVVAGAIQAFLAAGGIPSWRDLQATYIGVFATNHPAAFFPLAAALIAIGIAGPIVSGRLQRHELRQQLDQHVPDILAKHAPALIAEATIAAGQDLALRTLQPVRVRDLRLVNYRQGSRPVEKYFPIAGYDEARAGLQAALDGQGSGIVLAGRPMLGKTRMALEALRATTPDFTLLYFNPDRSLPDLLALAPHFAGQDLALLLDDLQFTARRPEDAQKLITGVRALQAAARRCVIVATVRVGDDEDLAMQTFASLFETLDLRAIRLAPLTDEAARAFLAFAADATATGQAALHRDEFDGTPGSVLLGLARRTVQLRSPDFPAAAKAILKALALLRAADITPRSVGRARRVASAIFALPPTGWQAALEYLVRNEWLTLGVADDTDATPIGLPSDAYLERCLPQAALYPLAPRRVQDDFAALCQALRQAPVDADALFDLAWALTQDPLGNKAAQNELALEAAQAGLVALDRALDPQRWAAGQHTLGNAYSDRIRGDRAQNLEDAIAAFTASLEVYTRQDFPIQWATTQNNLGEALRQRIRGDRAQNLEDAIAAYTASLEVCTRQDFPIQWAETTFNVALLYAQMAQSAFEQNDTTQGQRLRHQALTEMRSTLIIFTAEGFPDMHQRVNAQIARITAIVG